VHKSTFANAGVHLAWYDRRKDQYCVRRRYCSHSKANGGRSSWRSYHGVGHWFKIPEDINDIASFIQKTNAFHFSSLLSSVDTVERSVVELREGEAENWTEQVG
jgi:hypothetical protein